MDNPLFYLLLGFLVAWAGSYFYSLQHNQRKLRLLALWLRDSLHILGAKPSSTRHGPDRLDIIVSDGRGNIREAAMVMGMQSRQLFRALISLVRGGRDSLSVLVSLQGTPTGGSEFEIFEASGPLPKTVIAAAGTVGEWEVETYASNPAYKIAFRTDSARDAAIRALTLLLDDRFSVRRLSLRATAPHIFLILNLVSLPQVESASLLRLVRSLADEAVGPVKPDSGKRSRPAKSSAPSRRPIASNPSVLPGDNRPPAPGLDPGLTHNQPRSTNGHKPHDE